MTKQGQQENENFVKEMKPFAHTTQRLDYLCHIFQVPKSYIHTNTSHIRYFNVLYIPF